MVKKQQKVKASGSSKPSASVKKATAKPKKEENLKNGLKDNESENTETEAQMAEKETIESNEEKLSQEGKSVEVPKSRKRRAPDVANKKGPTKTAKAKRQKVVIEIPKLSPISGKVFVVGTNDVGQLGLGEDIAEKRRPALLELPNSIVDIAAGGMHSVCLTESGEVITFGCNDEGALGRNTEAEEGSEYIPRKVEIPERIVQISAGDSHSAALSESGQVYIWGNFRNGNGSMGLVADGVKQNTPIRILNNVTIVKISSGSDHLTCLSQEGVVYTCGCGEAGQLGRVSEHSSVDGGRKGTNLLLTPDRVPITKSDKSSADNIWTESYATFVKIQENGSIYAFGLNNYGQLGVDSQQTPKPIFKPMHIESFNNKTWSQISGGQHHTVALDDNGLVYSLGRSEYGRLGLGENSDDKSVPTTIPSLQDKKCINISCGNVVSLAVTDNGSVFSWGMGDSYQLGHGDESDQHAPKLVEGKFFDSWKALKIAGGGQHTIILAQPRKTLEKSQ